MSKPDFRWSRNEQRAVALRTNVPPPDPPQELDKAERQIWRSIVSELPGDWFARESQPVLKELCRHIRNADLLAKDLVKVREALNDVELELGRVTERSKAVELWKLRRSLNAEYFNLLKAQGHQSDRIGSLATKLRLTNQSKIVVSTAITKAKTMPPPGPTPWDDWGDNKVNDAARARDS